MARLGRKRHVLRERQAELAALEDLFKAAAGGIGSFNAVVGPAGIGKSSLVAATAESARQLGLQVFQARGTELERSFGFGVIRQLFESTVRTADDECRSTIGRGVAERAVKLVAGLDDTDRTPTPDALLSMTNAIYWLVANLSDRAPLLLIIDDLHWADAESVSALEFLQSRVEELPVVVLVAARPDHDDAVTRLLETAPTFTLGPLSQIAVGQMIRESLGDPDDAFTRAATAVSGGNPFYVTELIAELATDETAPVESAATRVHASGPVTVGKSVVARLSRLSPNARAVARAVLILGGQAAAVHIAQFAEIDLEALRRAAAELISADVLGTGNSHEFAHPIIRSALSDVASGHELADGHARAVTLLESSGADPEVVVAHIMASPAAADQGTVARLRQAAQLAMSRGAPSAAVSYLSRALAEPPAADQKGEVLLELGLAEMLLQDPACFFHLVEARELLPPGPLRAEAGLAVARCLAFAGEVSLALAEGAKAKGFDRETDLFLDALTMAASMTGRGDAGIAEIVARSETLAGTTPGERAALALAAFIKTKSSEPLADISPIIERVIANGGVTLMAADGFSPSCLLACLSFAGQHLRCVNLCTQLIQEAERRGSLFFRAQYSAIRAGALYRLGRLVEAAADARFSLETAGAMDVTLPIAQMTLVESLIALGRLDEAKEAVALLPPPGVREDLAMRASAVWTHGHLQAELGDASGGIAVMRESGRLVDEVGAVNPTIIPWRIVLVEQLARAGHLEQSESVASAALADARRHGSHWTIGSLLRGLAMSRREESVALLSEAVELLDDGESNLALAQALVDLGAELRRRGRRRQAREPLARGLQLAGECGTTPLIDRAELELQACGASTRATVGIGVDSLTPSEWRVAQLAAHGNANREIAQSLFVTEKTVEKHLGNAYRKLGITKRSQLMPMLRTPARSLEE